MKCVMPNPHHVRQAPLPSASFFLPLRWLAALAAVGGGADTARRPSSRGRGHWMSPSCLSCGCALDVKSCLSSPEVVASRTLNRSSIYLIAGELAAGAEACTHARFPTMCGSVLRLHGSHPAIGTDAQHAFKNFGANSPPSPPPTPPPPPRTPHAAPTT